MEHLKTLIAIPSSVEWRALFPMVPCKRTVQRPFDWNEKTDVVCAGVGLVGFTKNLLQVLLAKKYRQVILIGVAGAFPNSGLSVGDIVRVDSETVADEGYLNEGAYKPYFRRPRVMLGTSIARAPQTISALAGVRGCSVNLMTTDPAIIQCRSEFFDAKVESMEGAAAFAVAKAVGVPLYEVRAISNIVGETDQSKWNFTGSLRALKKTVIDPIFA